MKRTAVLFALLLASGCMTAEESEQRRQVNHAIGRLPESDKLQCELVARSAENPRYGFLEQMADYNYTQRLCLRAILARRSGN